MPVRNSVLLCVAVGLFLGTAVEAQRLPSGVHPEHYELALTPDLHAATFSGQETIDVVLDAPGKTITLNAAEIKFGEVTAYSGKHSQTATIALDAEKEQVTFTFANDLPAGRVSLK